MVKCYGTKLIIDLRKCLLYGYQELADFREGQSGDDCDS